MIHTIMKSGLTPMAEKQLNDNFRNLEREAENKGLQRQQSIIYLESVIPSSYNQSPANYQQTKRIFIPKNNKTTLTVTTYTFGTAQYTVKIFISGSDTGLWAGTVNLGDGKTRLVDILNYDITRFLKENEINEIAFSAPRNDIDIDINATIITE